MALPGAHPRIAQLWQMPLLVVSLGLFAYAAYLLIDPRPGLSVEQKIAVARHYMKHDRPEAAIEQLNQVLRTEKLPAETEGAVHLMLAEALEQGQRLKRLSIPANYERIIEQTQIALGLGIEPTAQIHRRLGASYEALQQPAEALGHYRQAMAMDADLAPTLRRSVIDLQMAQQEYGAAEASLNDYLAAGELRDSERAWATVQKSRLLIERGQIIEARSLLKEAMRLDSDPVAQGEINFRLGQAALKLGDIGQAERHLRTARDQLRVRHPLDAEAAYLLGRIHQEKNEPQEAISFYQVVLVSHPDSAVAPLARLGRGVCRIMLKEDDAGLMDLHELVSSLGQRASRAVHKPQAVTALQQAAEILAGRGNLQGALELLAHEQSLTPPPPSFFARLASVYERRADQVEQTIAEARPADQIRRVQQVADLRSQAGDAYIAWSRGLTLMDDKGYGDALWRGIDLYDRAGNVQRVISALELFVAERPEDSMAPDALLRLGRAFQGAGMFDKAIEAYQRNQFRYPQSLAASKSAVPLAQAYIAKGPDSYGRAETVLLSVIDNNPLLTPDSQEFQQALFEVAQLYYRTGRYEEAVARLEEWTQRYPDDERMGQLIFLMADSYRKSASLLEVRVATATADLSDGAGQAFDAAEAEAARRQRLTNAKLLYDRAIELYRGTPPAQEIDRLYLKLSHFYRADCVYDLGQYEEAIRLYDAAAFRYQEDPSALAAYVQIVNAYCALGRIEEARTANERAKWLLRRMPGDAFRDGTFAMPKEYWEQWLKWTTASGMW